MKKVLGYFLIFLSIVMILVMVGQFPKVFGMFVGISQLLTGKLDAYLLGNVLGNIVYWFFHSTIIFFLWNKGRKLAFKSIK